MENQIILKKDGFYVVLCQYGVDDYLIWFTHNYKDESRGISIRGSKAQLKKECEGDITKEELEELFIINDSAIGVGQNIIVETTTLINAMKESLVQYYEAAGFNNVEQNLLKEKTDEEIKSLYNEMNRKGSA